MPNDVRRPKQYEEMLKKLCQGERRIFATFKEALVFSACLGFQEGRRVAFDKSSEPVAIEIFHAEFDEAIIRCIGLVETGDPTIMGVARHGECVRIFEEYACGGLEILEAEVYQAPGEWEQHLLALVAKQNKSDNSVLDDITQAFD
jgi:dnd system-associated protein 4